MLSDQGEILWMPLLLRRNNLMALIVDEYTFSKQHNLCSYEGIVSYIATNGPKENCMSPLKLVVSDWYFSSKTFYSTLDYDDDCVVDSEYQLFWNKTYTWYIWKTTKLIAEIWTDRIFVFNRGTIENVAIPTCTDGVGYSFPLFLWFSIVVLVLLSYLCKFLKKHDI